VLGAVLFAVGKWYFESQVQAQSRGQQPSVITIVLKFAALGFVLGALLAGSGVLIIDALSEDTKKNNIQG